MVACMLYGRNLKLKQSSKAVLYHSIASIEYSETKRGQPGVNLQRPTMVEDRLRLARSHADRSRRTGASTRPLVGSTCAVLCR